VVTIRTIAYSCLVKEKIKYGLGSRTDEEIELGRLQRVELAYEKLKTIKPEEIIAKKKEKPKPNTDWSKYCDTCPREKNTKCDCK
jgi:hypothetical protein